MEQNRTFLPNLNGLRFIGALAVLVFHVFTLEREIWGDFTSSSTFQSISKVASKGHHGVGLFFVLSGFLITYLLLKEIKENGSIQPFNFLMRRILRIWPLYFLIVIFGFFIFPHLPHGQETEHSLLNYSFFLSNFDEIWNGANDSLNFLTVTWSISIEEQFYLCWILLLFLFPFFRKGKYLASYFIAIILSVILFRFFNHANDRVMYYHTFACASDLAIGGLSAIAVQRYSIQNFIMNLTKWQLGIIYLLGISSILGSTVIFKEELRSIERLVHAFFFAFVILEQVYSQHSFWKADRIPGFFKGGEITYGIYMYHCVFIYYTSIYFKQFGLTESAIDFLLYCSVVFLFTYGFSILSKRYFEQPFLTIKSRFRRT
jgi:peptidoglycan/LPS O-acetylase OafA/YrhL